MPLGKVNLMLVLAEGDMASLHADFLRLGNALDASQFASILRKHCPLVAKNSSTGSGAGHHQRDPVATLFFHVDMNGDGRVSWDDLFDYAVGTANERMQTLPAEQVRPYTFSRNEPRQDNVLLAEYFPDPDLLFLSSRHVPMQLLRPESLQVVHQFSPRDMGGSGALPICAAYLSANEMLAVVCDDMRLRIWSSIDRVVPAASKPLQLEARIPRIRTVPSISPHFIVGCDSGGNALTIEVSRQATGEPRIRSSVALHDRLAGGASDICIWKPIESRIVTSGFDNKLLWTDLEAMRTTLIGTTPSVLRRVEYFEQHQFIVAAGHDHAISAWVTHQSQKPCTMFVDASRPHKAPVVGLHCVQGSPQVLSCDAAGIIKVWDIRNFRCAQTFAAIEGFNAEAESGLCKPLDDQLVGGLVNTFCFVDSMNESCAISSDALHFHAYNRGAEPKLSTDSHLLCARYNPLSHTILALTSNTVQSWDADLGHLASEQHKTPKLSDMTMLTLDGVGRRMFIGTQAGDVEIRSCDGGSVLTTLKHHRGEVTGLEYALSHRALLSIGSDGFLTVVTESDTYAPPQRVKLSSHPLLALTFSRHLSLLAAGGKNGTVYVMDVVPPRSVETEIRTQSAVESVCFLSPFPLLVTGHENGDVMFWSVRPVREEVAVLHLTLQGADVLGHLVLNRGAQKSPGWTVRPKSMKQESASAQKSSALAGSLSASSYDGGGSVGFSPVLEHSSQLNVDPIDHIIHQFSRGDSGGARLQDVRATCMAFDSITHTLFVATNRGMIWFLKCCGMLQALRLPTCHFPQSPSMSIRSSLDAIQRSGEEQKFVPEVVASVHAHKDDIVDLQMMSHIDVVVSCGADRRIMLFDVCGTRLAELCQGRIPAAIDLVSGAQGNGAPMGDSMNPVTSPVVASLPAAAAGGSGGGGSSGGNSVAPGADAKESASVAPLSTAALQEAVNSAPPSPRGAAVPASVVGYQPRKSRRPTVDRILNKLKEPAPDADSVTTYHELQPHKPVPEFDLSAASAVRSGDGSRNTAATASTTAAAAATPGSTMKKRRAQQDRVAKDGISSLLAPVEAPIGSHCRHVLATGAASASQGTTTDETPVSQRRATQPVVAAVAFALPVEAPAAELLCEMPSGEAALSANDPTPSGDAADRRGETTASAEGDDMFTPLEIGEGDEGHPSDAFHAQVQGSAAWAAASLSIHPPSLIHLAERQSRLAQNLQTHRNKLQLDTSAAVDTAASNHRHLVTLLRNLGDYQFDWMSGDARALHDSEEARHSGEDHVDVDRDPAAKASPRPSTNTPRGTAAESKETEEVLARVRRGHGSSGSHPSSRSAQGEEASLNAHHGTAVADDVDGSTASASGGSAGHPTRPPLSHPQQPPTPPHSRGSSAGTREPHRQHRAAGAFVTPDCVTPSEEISWMNGHAQQHVTAPTPDPHVELATVVAVADDVNVADTDLPPPSGRGGALAPVRPPVSRRPVLQQRAGLPPTVPPATVLVPRDNLLLHVPETAGPQEALRVLHAAWTLAFERGGTALHYLGGGHADQPLTAHQTARPSTSDRGGDFTADGRPGSYAGSRTGCSARLSSASTGLRVGIARLVNQGVPHEARRPSTQPGRHTLVTGASPDEEPHPLVLFTGGASSSVAVGPGAHDHESGALSPRRRSPRQLEDAVGFYGGGDNRLVGIHKVTSPRASSGNVYISRVRHGHVSLGAPVRPPRGPPRADAKSARIALLEDELRRCLQRQPQVHPGYGAPETAAGL